MLRVQHIYEAAKVAYLLLVESNQLERYRTQGSPTTSDLGRVSFLALRLQGEHSESASASASAEDERMLFESLVQRQCDDEQPIKGVTSSCGEKLQDDVCTCACQPWFLTQDRVQCTHKFPGKDRAFQSRYKVVIWAVKFTSSIW